MATMTGQAKIDFDAHIATAKTKVLAGDHFASSDELEAALAIISINGFKDNLADWGKLRSLTRRMQRMVMK